MSEASVALKLPRLLIEFRAFVLPLPAPMRRPLGHRDGSSTTSMRWVSGDDGDSGDAWQRVRLQAFINSGGRIRL